MRNALAIYHVAFEDLGSLGGILTRSGFNITMADACALDWSEVDPLAYDLVIVLGGPIGVYEQEAYPFLVPEIELIRARLARQRPTLGICLGGQLMAAAAGARVYPGTAGKEIGWGALHAGGDISRLPALSGLLNRQVKVLHWHGDTFDLPSGAWHLAGSDRYANQAFALGDYALGFQCHLEVTAAGLESWYVGHAAELAGAGVSVPQLREQSRRYAPLLAQAAGDFWQAWLAGVFA
ncbi:glutamine amidotransferase [Sodalis ligni]|jgi:GMP synthase (glutamine-hydrolysing)|uniref:GMP synthase (Glutamine-hydrolysing) n=1 Tax=Sodalis ligni TaxID=2697027 RepID=A0A4R1NEE1_9GAMM|nr:glutamine amidotransferase [Sodalis ligni]TCL05267.1 GMP synthase (glutamine-hydrolysing) [Sodalis ligni]